MKLLAGPVTCSPESIFDDAEQRFDERDWRVVHTKPRQEKRLAMELATVGLPVFLPIVKKQTRIDGRKAVAHLPAFPGYLFFRSTMEERSSAWRTNRVVRLLEVPQQESLTDQLSRIHRAMLSGRPLDHETSPGVGSIVTVLSGPFAGFTGKVIRLASKLRLVIEVEFLQQAVSVLLDDSELELVR